MNSKGRFFFPLMGIIMVLVAAVICMVFFNVPHQWKENGFASMSPWIFLIPIFIVAMIVMCIFCWKRHGGNMCDWEGWKHWQDRDKEPGGQDPKEILKTRLAKGEINEEEYDRLLAKISRETPGKE